MASSSLADRPLLVIIGGPNGSGKSQSYNDTRSEFEGRGFWIVNPDLLTAELIRSEGIDQADANLAAVQRLEAWLYASLDVRRSVGVETVLSTDKYRKLVTQAQLRGYEVWLIYVFLDSPDLNVARVATRVAKGGHAVPEARIRARYERSLAQLPWFLEHVDRAWLFDNSGAAPRLAGRKDERGVTLLEGTPQVLRNALGA